MHARIVADEDREEQMKSTRVAWTLTLLTLGILASSCGGGGDSIGVLAAFLADPPSAGPRVSMEPGAASGAVFSVEIHASGFTDLYGAAFTVLYDPAQSTYLGCEAQGSILSTTPGVSNDCDDTLVGGAKFAAALQNGVPGTLNLRASRDGLVAGVSNGTGLLLTLTFEAEGTIPPPGDPYLFEEGPSREIETCPQDLSPCSFPAAAWDGGVLIANPI
jgi:hypothetical protein